MTTIEIETPATVTVTAISNGPPHLADGALYNVQLGTVALLGIEVVHEMPLSPVAYLPRGLRLDAATESLVLNSVLFDYLGIDEPCEVVETPPSGGDRYRR